MRIGGRPGAGTAAEDLAGALRERATTLGHRPAVTVYSPGSREEQGFASLAQWAAKGAHLLTLDVLAEPGDRLVLAGPAGWMPAAVASAAWWAGLTVATDGPADVAVVHERATTDADADATFAIGDAIDGTPRSPGVHEPWAVAVQAFPDQPPPPRTDPELAAVDLGGRVLSHREVLAAAAALGGDGPVGVESEGLTTDAWLLAVCARPLATGHPTVVLRDGAERAAAAAEGVRAWIA